MSLLSSFKLEAFARLIALGWPPVLAARAARFRNMRASRSAARLAQPGVSARVEALEPRAEPDAARPRPAVAGAKTSRAVAKPDAEFADDGETGRPALRPELTEDEWMAKYAPHLLAKGTAAA